MTKQKRILTAVIATLLVVITLSGYHHWMGSDRTTRADVLARMPPAADAVLYLDLEELRSSPFLAALYNWAPRPQADADYKQFMRDTGFDFERDLDRLAIAVFKNVEHSAFFAVASGRFDQRKISAYAKKVGREGLLGNKPLYVLPSEGGSEPLSLLLLRKDQIVITNDAFILDKLPDVLHLDARRRDWQPRFERLAGSPIFAVIRQDAGAGSALAAQAPGGLRSPQLSALLDQLQWITLAGQPENDSLRVVAEGECTADATASQLTDVLNGIVILAQAGLNDTKTRKQLDPAARDAYLELLKSADISKLDRGETKSVRVIFELTPKFLDAARTAAPSAPLAPTPQKPAPGKTSTRK